MDNIFVDDVGTQITLNIEEDNSPVDVSGASSANIRYKKPGVNGASGSWTATIGTTDISYITVEDDLDAVGVWQLQAEINGLTTWSGSSTIIEMTVKEIL
ncbi:MAG: hypothetical protein ACTSWQ_00845 [Candidatus Thorarchaeota archaeon]